MTGSLERLVHLADECSEADRKALLEHLAAQLPRHPLEEKWGVGAEIILSAIARSSDLTKRGVRGIIAEAVFERNVLPGLEGWEPQDLDGDQPYDFLVRPRGSGNTEIRIQVKLQRMRKHEPMLACHANRHYPEGMYVVEVQKTRGGIDPTTRENTRPYHFGEFDILAVNMHPSTRDWNRFLFTVGAWLIPRAENADLIEIFQPVPEAPNGVWTDRLEECVRWLLSGDRRRVLKIDPSLLRHRDRRSKKGKPKRGRKARAPHGRRPRRLRARARGERAKEEKPSPPASDSGA